MSDCDCDQLEKHVDILKEILTVRKDILNQQTTPRIGILMRMLGNEVKGADKAKTAALRKEIIQVAATCVMYLETL